MKRDELGQRLKREGVRPEAYDFEGTQKDEVYCMEETPAGWVVYYRERGLRRDEHLFSSESDASRFLLELVLRDPTTRVSEKQ